MSDSLLTAISNALVGRWLGDTALVVALGGQHVFSRQVPPDFAFPDAAKHKYATVGDKTESSISVMGSGSSLTMTSHWWTRGYYEDGPVEELTSMAHAAAVSAPLLVTGYGPFTVRREMLAITGDPDVEYRHGVMRHRFSTLRIG